MSLRWTVTNARQITKAKAVLTVSASSHPDAVETGTGLPGIGDVTTGSSTTTLGCGAGTKTGVEVWTGTAIRILTAIMTVSKSGTEICSGTVTDV